MRDNISSKSGFQTRNINRAKLSVKPIIPNLLAQYAYISSNPTLPASELTLIITPQLFSIMKDS